MTACQGLCLKGCHFIQSSQQFCYGPTLQAGKLLHLTCATSGQTQDTSQPESLIAYTGSWLSIHLYFPSYTWACLEMTGIFCEPSEAGTSTAPTLPQSMGMGHL